MSTIWQFRELQAFTREALTLVRKGSAQTV
jgi:hypothetical protein